MVTIKDDAGNVITIDKDNAGDLKSAFKNEFTLGGTDAVSFVDEVTGANRTANVWESPFSENNPDGFDESEYLLDEKFSRPDKSRHFMTENGNRWQRAVRRQSLLQRQRRWRSSRAGER